MKEKTSYSQPTQGYFFDQEKGPPFTPYDMEVVSLYTNNFLLYRNRNLWYNCRPKKVLYRSFGTSLNAAAPNLKTATVNPKSNVPNDTSAPNLRDPNVQNSPKASYASLFQQRPNSSPPWVSQLPSAYQNGSFIGYPRVWALCQNTVHTVVSLGTWWRPVGLSSEHKSKMPNRWLMIPTERSMLEARPPPTTFTVESFSKFKIPVLIHLVWPLFTWRRRGPPLWKSDWTELYALLGPLQPGTLFPVRCLPEVPLTITPFFLLALCPMLWLPDLSDSSLLGYSMKAFSFSTLLKGSCEAPIEDSCPMDLTSKAQKSHSLLKS